MTEATEQNTNPDKGVDQTGTIIYNENRRREKLQRQAQRAHEWRVQVWAQSEQKIQALNAQLALLGADPYVGFEPDFTDPMSLAQYATMKLTK